VSFVTQTQFRYNSYTWGCSSVGLDLPAGRQGAALSMTYFVYIIRSKSLHKYYTGLTNNIERRLKEHNSTLNSTRTTKNKHDYELIFCQPANTRQEARKLEKFLKSGYGREIREEIVK